MENLCKTRINVLIVNFKMRRATFPTYSIKFLNFPIMQSFDIFSPSSGDRREILAMSKEEALTIARDEYDFVD